MIRGELRKLLSNRFLLVALCILFFANCFLTVSHIEENSAENVSRTFMNSIGRLAKRYNDDPDAFEDFRKEIEQKNADLMYAAYTAHPDGVFDPADYVSKEIDGENGDLQLILFFEELLSKRELTAKTPAIIASQAKDVIGRLRREGISDDAYAMQYQAYVYERYSALTVEKQEDFYPEYGWDLYFSNPYLTVCLFSAMLILTPLVFVPEKQTGMLPVLRACRRGRLTTAAYKTSVLALSGVFVTVLFSFSSLLIVYLKTGLSNAAAPIQSVDLFAAFPYAFSIVGHFFFTLLLRALAVLAFAFSVACVSVLTYEYIPSLLGGALLFGVNLLLENSPPSTSASLRVLNLTALCSGAPISQRFYSFDFFSLPLPFLIFAPIGLFFLLLLLFYALGFLYVRVTGEAFSHMIKPVKALVFMASEHLKKLASGFRAKNRLVKAHGLFVWELKKLLTLPVILLLVLLGTWQGFRCVQINQSFVPDYDYRSYLSTYYPEYEGVFTAEKARKAKAEKAYVDALQKKKKDISDGKIVLTDEERIAFSAECEKADDRAGALRVLLRQTEHLEKMQNEQGVTGWYIKYQSAEPLCLSEFSPPVYAGILLLSVLLFAREYRGKSKNDRFIILLRAAKHGRRKTFFAKYGVIALVSFILTLTFSSAELWTYVSTYNLAFGTLSAPLGSLEAFAEINCDLSILQYLFLVCFFRVVCSQALALIVSALSCILEQLLQSIAAALFLTAAPAVLCYIGLEKAAYVDLLALAGVSKSFLISAKTDLFSSDFGYFTLFFAVSLFLAAVLCGAAGRKYNR